jgi:hypothetical protein
MALPFRIRCETQSPILYALSKDRLQLMEQIALPPFVSENGILLVETALADFLWGLGIERIVLQSVTIFNPVSRQEITTHVRIFVRHDFSDKQLNDVDTEGLQMLTMNGQYYFVSAELKRELESAGFHYLKFSEGLSGFAGFG